MALTSGYIFHLREVAQQHMGQQGLPEAIKRRLIDLARYVAYMSRHMCYPCPDTVH